MTQRARVWVRSCIEMIATERERDQTNLWVVHIYHRQQNGETVGRSVVNPSISMCNCRPTYPHYNTQVTD